MLESEDKLSEEEKFEAELLYEREMSGWYDFNNFDDTFLSKIIKNNNNNNDSITNIPRPYSNEFAVIHPAAAAFNKAYKNTNTNNNSNFIMNSSAYYTPYA